MTAERARQRMLTAWAAIPGDNGISPSAAVAGMLGLAWRRAELLGEALRRQAENDAGPGDADAGGLVGYRYSASAAADGIYATGEQARALVELERAERELVVRFAEAGHRMGIEEVRVRLAEEQGAAVYNVFQRALSAMDLSQAQWEVARRVFPAELRAVGGQAADE